MCKIAVRVTPRAPRNGLAGWEGDVLKVRIAAPPVDGAANAALEKFLAKTLGLPARQVTVAAGQTGRRKIVDIDGLAPEEARAALT